jgi:hypothetical protein
MWFFFAIAVAGVYILNASPGQMRTQDFAMIGAVAAMCVMGLVDSIKR